MQAQRQLNDAIQRTVWLALAIVLAMSTRLFAAQPGADEARRTTRADALATFLNAKIPEAGRLAAAEQMGYPNQEAFAELLRVLATPTESDAIRAEAARRHPVDDSLIAAALKILRN